MAASPESIPGSAEDVLLAEVSLPGARYDAAGRIAFFDRARESLARVPGVEAVGAGGPMPLSGSDGLARFGLQLEERELDPSDNRVYLRRATPGYFSAMAIPLVRGRLFSTVDVSDSVPSAIVDEELVRRYFPNSDPIGKRVRSSNSETWREIVGVVGRVRQTSLLHTADPHLYVPQSQMPTSVLTFALRAEMSRAPESLSTQVTAAVAEIDPDLPVYAVRSLRDLERSATATERSNAVLLSVFAGLAAILVLIGVHSAVRYSVEESTRELGGRLALGARRSQVLGFVLARSLRLQLLGLVAGVSLAWAGARALSSVLHGVTPADPTTYLSTTVLVLAAGTLAAYLPARRALARDPIRSLR